MAWIAPVAGAAIGAVGSMMNASNTNSANMSINQQTMDWETEMSDTAMQRRVADLKAANLNPLLAVGQGGASTPGFSPISMQQAPVAQGVQAGVSTAQAASQIENTQADSANKRAQAALNSAQAANQEGTGPIGQAQVSQMLADTGLKNQTIESIRNQILNTQADTDYKRSLQQQAVEQIQNLVAQRPGISAQSSISRMDQSTQSQLMQGLISSAKQQQAAASSSAQAQAQFNNSWWGRLLHAVTGGPSTSGSGGGFGTAVKAVGTAASMVP